jgi:hypothetical protein
MVATKKSNSAILINKRTHKMSTVSQISIALFNPSVDTILSIKMPDKSTTQMTLKSSVDWVDWYDSIKTKAQTL